MLEHTVHVRWPDEGHVVHQRKWLPKTSSIAVAGQQVTSRYTTMGVQCTFYRRSLTGPF